MNEKREEICKQCRMLPSIRHPDYPVCIQPIAPMDEDEYRQLGVKPTDRPTKEGLKRMMQIAIRPYCLERIAAGGGMEF